MTGELSYHVRGRKHAGPVNLLQYFFDFAFSELGPEIVLELLFGFLELL